jgi:HEAT repeat protein
MALIKEHKKQKVKHLPVFSNLKEAIDFYEFSSEEEIRDYAVEEIVKFDGGADYLVSYIYNDQSDKRMATKIASVLAKMEPRKAPIEKIMNLLRLENAYVRNLGISILRNFGDDAKYYIVKFLIGDDRDLRIFAINVLGDVNFSESRDMLVEVLQKEQDINVAMTAVEYMGEIGEIEDIELLESLKNKFDGDYVAFAVDSAIKSIQG